MNDFKLLRRALCDEGATATWVAAKQATSE
jgi:hypothetical protein